MRSNRVLTFRDGRFVIASRNGSRNQLFKFDSKNGNIISYDQNTAVSINRNGKDRNLRLEGQGNEWFKNFRYEDDGHITN